MGLENIYNYYLKLIKYVIICYSFLYKERKRQIRISNKKE